MGHLQKQYESTIDEAVRAHFRCAELTGVVAKQRLYGFVGVPIGFVVAFAVFPGGTVERLALGTLLAVIIVPVHLLTYKEQMRKRIKKVLVKALGTDQPVPTGVELNDEGFVHRKMGQEIRFSWEIITGLSTTADAIELVTEPAGVAIIPTRIFSSPDERTAWLEFIETRLRGDHGAATPPPLPPARSTSQP